MNSGILIHPPQLPDKLSIARIGLIACWISKCRLSVSNPA
jgi:hypothetical protein